MNCNELFKEHFFPCVHAFSLSESNTANYNVFSLVTGHTYDFTSILSTFCSLVPYFTL